VFFGGERRATMRILVTGGRDFTDKDLVDATLDRLHAERKFTLVIHGAARGADWLAEEWARAKGVETLPCPANWRRYGRGAGSVRNQKMVELKPELVVAFPGGSGTAHVVELARHAGIEVIVVEAPTGDHSQRA
jgi:hypothetical protein